MAIIKFELGPIVFSPDATDEEKQKITASFEEYLKGAKQNLIGDARRKFVDGLIGLCNPERIKRMEEEIKTIHSIQDFERFRIQIYMLMADCFQGGINAGVFLNTEGMDVAKLLEKPDERKE